jgi:hypothetical protein
MTSIKLILATILQDTASRDSGAILRKTVLEHLKNGNHLEIDFTGVNLTPSFADEAFGLLCHHLSHKEFSEKIKFINLSISHKALLSRVVGNRFNSPKSS